MAEISNNVLAGLLVVAIVVSMFSIVTMSTLMVIPGAPTITGMASDTGLVNLTINESVIITLLRNETQFGFGLPEDATPLNIATNFTADSNCRTQGTSCFNNGSEGNGSDYGVGPNAYPFVAQIGGNDVTTCLEVAGSDADTFLGGESPTFEFAGLNNESTLTGQAADSCYSGLETAWTSVSAAYETVCTQTNHTDENDEVRIHWRLGIPHDAAGNKQNTITVCAAGDCVC